MMCRNLWKFLNTSLEIKGAVTVCIKGINNISVNMLSKRQHRKADSIKHQPYYKVINEDNITHPY